MLSQCKKKFKSRSKFTKQILKQIKRYLYKKETEIVQSIEIKITSKGDCLNFMY